MNRDIMKMALAGENLSSLHIVDGHCHMGPWFNYYFPKADVEEMMADADLTGVERICVAPHASISLDYRLGNRIMADAAAKYPDRVLGYVAFDPNRPEEIDEEFEKYYPISQVVGVKIHPSAHAYNINGENYLKVFDRMNELGGICLTHTWEDGGTCCMERCEDVIRQYPGTAFILGHSGGLNRGIHRAVALANRYENAYLDTSGFEFSNVWIEDIMKKVSSAKVIFGSDYPFHDLRGGLSRILLADMDDDTKLDVLGRSFSRLLEKYPKKWRQ
jgi:predicted TIM-barrel fold metal-dependent hydrolase